MKIDIPEPDEDEVIALGMFDWKADGNTVLEQVDKLLAKHGLEIVSYDTGADFYMFSLQPRDK